MSSFKITSGRTVSESVYAIGVNTGSLFILIPKLTNRLGYTTGVVLAGKGELAGKEGYMHEAPNQFFTPLLRGTVVEIIT